MLLGVLVGSCEMGVLLGVLVGSCDREGVGRISCGGGGGRESLSPCTTTWLLGTLRAQSMKFVIRRREVSSEKS